MVVDSEKDQCQQKPVVTKVKKPTDGRRCYAVRVCIEKNPTKIKCVPCEPCPAPPILPPLCNRPPVICCNCKSPPPPPPCPRPPPPTCPRPPPPPCCPRPQPPPPPVRPPCPKKKPKCQKRDNQCQTCNQCPRNEKNTQCCLAPPPPPKCRTQDSPCQTHHKETRHCGHQISPSCCEKHTKHCQTELDSGCCAEGVAHDRQACNKPCCRKPAAATNCGERKDACCNTTTAKANNCATGCGKGDGGESWNKKRANRKKCGNSNNSRRPPPPPAPIQQSDVCERKFEFPFLGRTSSGNLKVRPSMVSYENREFGILVANPECMRTSVKKITSCEMILSDPCPSPPTPQCEQPRPRPRPKPKPCGPCGDADVASTCRTAHQKLPSKKGPSHRVPSHRKVNEEYCDLESSPLEDEKEDMPKGRCTACSSKAKMHAPRQKMGRNERRAEREISPLEDEPEPSGRCTVCSSRANTKVSRNKMGHAESWNYVNPSVQKEKQCRKDIRKQQSAHRPPPPTTVSRGYQPTYILETGVAYSKHTVTLPQGQEGLMENEADLWDEDAQTSFSQLSRPGTEVSVVGSQKTLLPPPAFPHKGSEHQTGFMSDADGYHTPTELRFVAGSKTAAENYSLSIPMTTTQPSATSRQTQRTSPTLKSSAWHPAESEPEMVGKLHYVLKGRVDPDAKVTVGDAVFPVHSVVLEIRKRPESNKQKGQKPSTKEISNVELPDFNALPITYDEGPSEIMEDTTSEATRDETSQMGENEEDYVSHISMKPVDRVCNIGGGGGEKSKSKVEPLGWQDDYSMSDRIHTSAVGSSTTAFKPSEYKSEKSRHGGAPSTYTSAVGSSVGFLPEEYEAVPTRETHNLHDNESSVPGSEDEHPFSKSYHSGPAQSGQQQQQRSFYSASNIQSQQQQDEDTDTSKELSATKTFKSSAALPTEMSAHTTKSDLSRHQKELNPFSERPAESETEMSTRTTDTTESSGTVLLAPQSTEDTLMRLQESSGTVLYPPESVDTTLSTETEDANQELPYDPESSTVEKPRKRSHDDEDANAPKNSLLPNLDVIHGAIIAFGGINPRKPWAEWNNGKDVFMYTMDTDKWTKVGHLPAPRSHYGIARVGNDVYIIGGTDPSHKDSHHKNVAVSTNYKVNLRSGEWNTQLMELPQARSHFGCAAINKIIYVIGGNVDSRATETCLKYDTESQEWSEIASLDTSRSHMGIEVYKNGIVVAGGTCRDAKKPVLDTVMFYDPTLNSWTAWQSLPAPRAFSTLAVLGDKLYLVAGAGLRDIHKRRNTSLPDILYFNIDQNVWEEAGTLRHPRHGHASAVVDDSIVVIAGVSSHFQGPINAVDIWSPGLNSRKAHHFRHSQSGMSAITL